MRVVAPVVSAVLILGSLAAGSVQAQVDTGSVDSIQADDQQALRYLKEVAWPKAYKEQDVELLDQILADEFQMVDAEGIWSTRADELDYVRNNAPSYDSLRFEIKRLEIFENGTAIVAGKGVIRGSDEQGPYVVEYQSTNVLIKRAGRWQAIASHVSGITRVDPA